MVISTPNPESSVWRNAARHYRNDDDGLGIDPADLGYKAPFQWYCSDTWLFKIYPPRPENKTEDEWTPQASNVSRCDSPSVPRNVQAKGAPGSINLTWSAPATGTVTSYEYRARPTTPTAENPIPTAEATVTTAGAVSCTDNDVEVVTTSRAYGNRWAAVHCDWKKVDGGASVRSLTIDDDLEDGVEYTVHLRARNRNTDVSGAGPFAVTRATPGATPTPTEPPTQPPQPPPTEPPTPPPPATYQVTVQTAGDGTGTVTPSSGRYRGSQTFTASATGGSTFAGWSGCDSVSGSACSVNVTGPVTITATFDPPTYQVTVLKAGAGTGTVTPGSGRYRGSKTFTASATGGSTFAGWSGCDSVSGSVCTVNVTAAVTITATFERKTHTLRTSVSVCCGSIDVSPSGPYYHGDNTPVTLTARPQGLVFSFDSWGGDCEGETSATCDLTMNDDMDVTVAFSHSCDGNTGIGCGRQEGEDGDGEGSPPP